MRRVSYRLLGLVMVTTLISPRPGYGADKWLSIRSRNFLLVGNASESTIRRVGRELEEFRAALAMIFPRVNQPSSIATFAHIVIECERSKKRGLDRY